MQKGIGIIGVVITLCIIGILTFYFTSYTTQQIISEESGLDKTISRSAEASTKANLKILRAAIAKYYNEQNIYPDRLDDSGEPPFIPTYLRKIPAANLGMKVPNEIRNSSKVTYGNVVTNTGGWLYDPYTGKIIVNYDGLDSEGINYTTY